MGFLIIHQFLPMKISIFLPFLPLRTITRKGTQRMQGTKCLVTDLFCKGDEPRTIMVVLFNVVCILVLILAHTHF